MEPLPPHAKLAPLSAERFEWHFTVDKATQEQLRYVQSLLGHALPSGNVPEVIKRALTLLTRAPENQKFARCARPRPRRGAAKGRYIHAEVQCAVWKRGGGQTVP